MDSRPTPEAFLDLDLLQRHLTTTDGMLKRALWQIQVARNAHAKAEESRQEYARLQERRKTAGMTGT